MLIYKKQPYNSVWIQAKSVEELGLTFMRFQEHYESANPQFKNNIFTQGQIKRWYSETYGTNTYHKDWIGYNIPSWVLTPFKEGLFDPLTPEENELLDLLKYRKDSFYIIGAQDSSVLRHELAHALYFHSAKYREEIINFINKNKKKLKRPIQYIKDKGYCDETLYDEFQAYITDNDDNDLINLTCPSLIAGINKIYNKYNVEKVKK
jgi:hypothetical protein